MLYFFFSCRKFFHTTAVYDVNFFCTKTFCTSCSIHRYVTTTNDSNFLCVLDRGLASFFISLHQVNTCQEFVCGVNTLQTLSRNIHKSWKSGSGTYINGFVAHLKQFIDCEDFSDYHVCLYINTDGFQVVDLFLYDCFRKTEFRNTINKYTASKMKCFVNRYFVTHLSKISGYGKSTRTGSDHSHFMTILLRHFRCICAMFSVVICHKTLQTSDTNCFTFDTTDTFSLTLIFLWAHTSAYRRKRSGFGQDFKCAVHVFVCYALNKCRNVNLYRACALARFFRTVETSSCLVYCHIIRVAKCYFIKVFITNVRVLYRHRAFFHIHITFSHLLCLLF